MKLWKFTLPILFTAIYSCTKDHNLISDQSAEAGQAATLVALKAGDSYVSAWESGANWTRSDSSEYAIFLSPKMVPAITSEVVSGGAVLVWARNLPTADGVWEKPVLLPFYLLPDLGRPKYNEFYYYEKSNGTLTMKFRTNKGLYGFTPTPPPSDVQFRTFVLTPDMMQELKMDPVSITKLTYTQLLQLLNRSDK
jgi:hypothetical protein